MMQHQDMYVLALLRREVAFGWFVKKNDTKRAAYYMGASWTTTAQTWHITADRC
jgi:hypothetical protein